VISLYNWLLFVQVLAAMTWAGGGLMLTLVGARARSSTNPTAVGDFAGTALPEPRHADQVPIDAGVQMRVLNRDQA